MTAMLLRVAQRLRRSRVVRFAARAGLVARGVFYVLLAYLAAGIAAGWGGQDTQANANGALTTVAARPGGDVTLGAAALGFLSFAVVRLAGAYSDRRVGRVRRLTTAGQALCYLAMAAGVVAFLLVDHRTGSAQQQDSTAMALVGSPAGRIAMAGAGLAVMGVCTWQLRLAWQGGFADSLATEGLGPRSRALLHGVGRVGISCRAVALLPIGGLFVVAATRAEPREARDLDELLAALADDPVGRPLVWVSAAGFLVFGLYSLLEARFRDVHAGD